MKQLLRTTNAYRAISAGRAGHAALVLFADEKYLRLMLRECAKAFFRAEDGSRIARLIEEESFSDCIFLPAEGGKLTVDDGARIIDESLLRPVEGEKKLFVLDGFQNATALVQNKLLKVLEEPPAGVSFLLGATAEHTVLPTVLSRVSRFTVPPFREEEIYAALLRAHSDAEGAKRAAAASGGIFSAAENLLAGGGEDFRLAERFLALTDTEEICRLLDGRKDKAAFFSAVRLLLRDMLLIKTGHARFAATEDETVKKLADEYTAGALLAAERLLSGAERDIKFNAGLGQCAFTLAMRIGEEKEKWQKLS